VDYRRHDSGVRRHQGKALDGFHQQGHNAPWAHCRPGYPLSGCVPAEPDSVSLGSVRLASTEQCGKPPSDTGVMPQKILLYRCPSEKTARSYPHSLEKSPKVVEDGICHVLRGFHPDAVPDRTGWTATDLPVALLEPLAGHLPPAGGAVAQLLVVLRRSRHEVGVRMPRSVWTAERREGKDG
jgi:hypothetical protein